ncbi:MAG: cytochrome c1 [Acidiferrobacterales bacterium]|nr:cytochrome c1 [Acidiferrobacterales bacterium]
MKSLITSLLIFTFTVGFGSNAHAAGVTGVVDKANYNMRDMSSLQNGAKLFVNYCLSCHSAAYARYNRVAEDLGISEELLIENLMFTTEKVGDLMETAMTEEDAKKWFGGIAPPDLTLVSRVRKPDWVYTYLRAFYQDDSSPSGWNNSLFENVAMPHAMYELQGVQRLVGKIDTAHATPIDAHAADPAELDSSVKVVGDAQFELVHPGMLTPEEFDSAMLDLTAFLVYLAEPAQLKRKRIGVFTLAFLIILMGLSYLLKKEFWRDVH